MKKLILFLLANIVIAPLVAGQYETGHERHVEFSYQGELVKPATLRYNNSIDAMQLNIAYGYRFIPTLFVGVGTGVDYSIWQSINRQENIEDFYATSLPLYLRIKLNLMDAEISPFLSADLGYSFLLASNQTNMLELLQPQGEFKMSGFIAIPSIGVDYNFNDEMALYLSLGYHFHGTPRNKQLSSLQYISSVVARIGFKF